MNIRVAAAFASRLRGLLFRPLSWLGVGDALLLAPCGSIHTCFMKVPIDVAFVDEAGVVVRSEEKVPPWRFLSNRKACMVLERLSPPAPSGMRSAVSVRWDAWPKAGDRLKLESDASWAVTQPREQKR